MFLGKKITFCVCGSLFAYRIPEVISWLKENEADVQIALSPSALDFVTPKVMAELSGSAVAQDIFTLDEKWRAIHIDIADCDLFVIAPADKSILSKIAIGMADDLISASFLATSAPVLILPDPGIIFSNNKSAADNIAILTGLGHNIITSEDNISANKLIDKLKNQIEALLIGYQKNII